MYGAGEGPKERQIGSPWHRNQNGKSADTTVCSISDKSSSVGWCLVHLFSLPSTFMVN